MGNAFLNSESSHFSDIQAFNLILLGILYLTVRILSGLSQYIQLTVVLGLLFYFLGEAIAGYCRDRYDCNGLLAQRFVVNPDDFSELCFQALEPALFGCFFFSFCHWITSYQRLFGFFVHCVLFAESAVLLCLHSLRMVLFLFCHVVITLFAFSTCQCDFYAHDFHLHCVFALSLVILADQRRPFRFCPAFAARTSAISGIKKRPSSMSLVYCSNKNENYFQTICQVPFWVLFTS